MPDDRIEASPPPQAFPHKITFAMTKRMRCLPLLLLPLLLQGCGGVLTEMKCRNGPLQQQVSSLWESIVELRGNARRGYALHVQYVSEQEPYTDKDEQGREVTRYRRVERRVETPVSIDVEDQLARAEALERSVGRIEDAAEQEYLKCLAANR